MSYVPTGRGSIRRMSPPGLVERLSAWIALQADRFADRLEDWADGLQARHEAPAAPGGPYRSRVEAPVEPPVPRDYFAERYATGGVGHRIGEVLEYRGGPQISNASPFAAEPRPHCGQFDAVREPAPDFLAGIARRDPRLAVALLGSVPPAPLAEKCLNCGAPHDVDRRCRYCGVERAGTTGAAEPERRQGLGTSARGAGAARAAAAARF